MAFKTLEPRFNIFPGYSVIFTSYIDTLHFAGL